MIATLLLAVAPLVQDCPLQVWSAPEGQFGDLLGVSVDVQGDLAVVGEPLGEGNGPEDVGAVHVLERRRAGWERIQRISLGSPFQECAFGLAVDLEGDLLAVGAPQRDGPYSETGSVFLYRRRPGGFELVEELRASNPQNGERQFGVAIDIDGDRMLVGALAYEGADEDSGVAFVFERSGDSWVEVARLAASDGQPLDFFAGAVALAGDVAVVGSSRDDGPELNNFGAAYVFERTDTGWVERQKLRPEEINAGGIFGSVVVIDAPTVLISAPRQRNPSGTVTVGAVYEFELVGAELEARGRIDPAQTISSSLFGAALSLRADRLLVGAPNSFSSTGPVDPGFVEQRRRVQGVWELERTYSGAQDTGRFGSSVALTRDWIAIGARLEDGAAEDSGRVHFGAPYTSSIESYCEGLPNSTGTGATLAVLGTPSLFVDDLSLSLSEAVPGTFGMFLYGPQRVEQPFGDGLLCVGPGSGQVVSLVPATLTDLLGSLVLELDLHESPFASGPGTIEPGTTWNFQGLYRDPQGSGGWNSSDAAAVRFCP